jgi:putative ABC transport system permease protein
MRRWWSYWARLIDLARRSRLERDIDDELRFHVESEMEAGVQRGLSEEEARRQAHDSLGGPPLLVREQIHDARRVSLSDEFRADLRQGLRLLRRAPAVTAVVLLTLGVAIGGTVTTFSITDAWLFRPLHFPSADRLVVAFMATAAKPTEPAVWMPYRAYLSWKQSARSFSSVSAAFFRGATWRGASGAKSLVGMRVTPEFFATLGVPALRGRHLTAGDATGSPAVVLSYGFWQRDLGGTTDIVGGTISLSDIIYTVVGIMPPDFDVRLLDRPEGAAFWTLFRPGDRGYEPGGMGPVTILGRLAKGVSVQAARAEAAAVMEQAERAYPLNFNQPDGSGNRFVVNLSSLQEDNARTVRSTLLTVLGAAVCLLLIAAMNVGVLLFGQGLKRRNEVAVRHAVGAGRSRLVRQFMTESLVLSIGSSVLALGLAMAALRVFVAANPLGTLPASGVQLDLRAAAVAALAVVITTIVAGLAPALRLSATDLGATLRSGEGGRTTAPTQRAQRGMLVAQIAVSTVLLVCAALLAKTVFHLRAEPLGFSPDAVEVAEVALPLTPFDSNAARNGFYDALADRLRARPGVRAVAAATLPPLAGGEFTTVRLGADNTTIAPHMSAPSVTPAYFDTLSIPLVAGRHFDRRDTAEGRPVVVLNALAAAQLFGDGYKAVGQRVRLGDDSWCEVVGVVGNVRTTFFNTLEWQTAPVVYRPAAQSLSQPPDPEATHLTLWVHIRADRPLSADDVRGAALAAGPRAAVLSVQPVPDMVANATRQPAFRMTLLLWFCGASLLLAGMGIYGIVAQAVTERLREIAIRVALGAQPRALTLSFVRQALAAGVSGLVIGVVLSMMFARLLASMLYSVPIGDVSSLLAAALLMLAVTGVAAWVPALRATRVPAVHVLRT